MGLIPVLALLAAASVRAEITCPAGFAPITPGEFIMGGLLEGDPADEFPRHTVAITDEFCVSQTEITRAQWIEVMGTTPWLNADGTPRARVFGVPVENPAAGDNYPAQYVSWEDALDYIARVNAAEDADHFRLPTEAEWEYACRAGSQTAFAAGVTVETFGQFAWYSENTVNAGEDYPHETGGKTANGFDLQDTFGNVWEWCLDWYDANYYAISSHTNPAGPSWSPVSTKVIRGGSFQEFAQNPGLEDCRVSNRSHALPQGRFPQVGFRLVWVQNPPPRPPAAAGDSGGGCFLGASLPPGF